MNTKPRPRSRGSRESLRSQPSPVEMEEAGGPEPLEVLPVNPLTCVPVQMTEGGPLLGAEVGGHGGVVQPQLLVDPAQGREIRKGSAVRRTFARTSGLDRFRRSQGLGGGTSTRVAPADRGLTGLDSYVWLEREPRPATATAGVGGLTVTAEARPVQYVWSFGDGPEEVTLHPGREWRRGRPGNIAHVYETHGDYDISVEVIWEARWRIGSGAWRSLGYFSNSDARAAIGSAP